MTPCEEGRAIQPEITQRKRQRPAGRCLSFFAQSGLLHPHADFGFVNGLLQVFKGLRAVAVEVVLGDLQFVFGGAHVFQSFINVRMPLRDCCRCRRTCRRGITHWW